MTIIPFAAVANNGITPRGAADSVSVECVLLLRNFYSCLDMAIETAINCEICRGRSFSCLGLSYTANRSCCSSYSSRRDLVSTICLDIQLCSANRASSLQNDDLTTSSDW